MFCQLDRLRRCLSPRIRRALDELPETLDGTYERTLLDIDDENWSYAHRLFQCIVVAQRPLRVEELAEFLAFKSETRGNLTFDGNWRPENPRDTVLSTCSSLIAIVNVDGSPVMQFSHFSVKEYLTSNRIAQGRVSRYYIPLEQAHLFVTQACLSLLLHLDIRVTKTSIKELPLARYAGQYWTDHAKFGNVSSHTEDSIKRLFNPRYHHYMNWVWIYNSISHQSVPSEVPTLSDHKLLHHAAQHGFLRVVEWLITTHSQDVNVLASWGTPLHIASRNGRLDVVQVLLEHRADVNAVTVDGWTPLHFASWLEHPRVARVLLDHGADVDSETTLSETALHLGSERGNSELAQLLLERGANSNAGSRFYKNSLYFALLYDHPGVAQLLLKHGADPNAHNVDGWTQLHVASLHGDLKVAQKLLELGADVNARNNREETPLLVALNGCDADGNKPHWVPKQGEREQVAQLLLQHGAEST